MNAHRRTFLAGAVGLALCGPAWPADLPEFKGFALGKPEAAAPEVLAVKGGEFTLTGGGRSPSAHTDEGAFAGFHTEVPNFTFVARVARAADPDKGARYGIVARAGLAGNEKAVALRYDAAEGRRCLQWFMRYHVVANTHQGSRRCFIDGTAPAFDKPTGTWLKIVRRYPFVEYFASADGNDWQALPYRGVLQPERVWVGLQVTAGQAKEPLAVTFDNVSFTADRGAGTSAETRATFKEYAPKKKYAIYFAKVNTGTPAKPAFGTAYVVIPEGMEPKAIRCLLWTPGSKEIPLADGGTLPFRSGEKNTPEAGLRLPADFDKDEGVYVTDKLDPVHAALAHHGIVRLGTLHHAYPESLKRLAEVAKIPELEHLPFVATGASAAGGSAAAATRKFPDRALACCPTLIGAAGIEEVEKFAHVPFLHIVGSKDGVHLKHVTDAAPVEREKHALWDSAPMWFVYHHTHKQQALMIPYFVDCLGARVPTGHDFATGPAKLTALKEEDGYLGLIDTWETNFPRAVPFKEFKGERSKTVWLPTARTARAWQAFVSYDPRTVIHFPAFEGHNTIGQPQPNGWHNSHLVAGEPFEVAASGPTGPGVKVKFYADLEPLKVKAPDPGNPSRVTAEGLSPGLHVLYAVTTIDGKDEISRPVTVMFHRKAAR